MSTKIIVYAKPGAKENKVERVDDGHFVVSVKEPPQDGRANAAIEKILAEYFGIARSCVAIVHGRTSKRKIIEVQN